MKESDAESASNATPVNPIPCTATSAHVLLAEDNEINRRLVVTVLQNMGHTVVAVANGEEALKALTQEKFDLILMDVQMPVVDGLEATLRIRSDTSQRFDPMIPIVALTATAPQMPPRSSSSTGMNYFVAKPIEFRRLASVIDQIMSTLQEKSG